MKLRRSFGEADESLQIFKRSVTVDPGPDGTGGGSPNSGLGFGRVDDECVEFYRGGGQVRIHLKVCSPHLLKSKAKYDQL